MLAKADPTKIQNYTTVRAQFDEQVARERLEWAAKNDVEWYVYIEEGEVLAWGLISWRGKETVPDYPDLFDLYVREDARSRGIGTALISSLEDLVRAKGFTKIGLAVNPTDNPHALQLYQRLGYKIINDVPYLEGVYDGNEDWCVDMEKSLSP